MFISLYMEATKYIFLYEVLQVKDASVFLADFTTLTKGLDS